LPPPPVIVAPQVLVCESLTDCKAPIVVLEHGMMDENTIGGMIANGSVVTAGVIAIAAEPDQ
jgi:hypothetical protein